MTGARPNSTAVQFLGEQMRGQSRRLRENCGPITGGAQVAKLALLKGEGGPPAEAPPPESR
jgi:hypothetical protein